MLKFSWLEAVIFAEVVESVMTPSRVNRLKSLYYSHLESGISVKEKMCSTVSACLRTPKLRLPQSGVVRRTVILALKLLSDMGNLLFGAPKCIAALCMSVYYVLL